MMLESENVHWSFSIMLSLSLSQSVSHYLYNIMYVQVSNLSLSLIRRNTTGSDIGDSHGRGKWVGTNRRGWGLPLSSTHQLVDVTTGIAGVWRRQGIGRSRFVENVSGQPSRLQRHGVIGNRISIPHSHSIQWWEGPIVARPWTQRREIPLTELGSSNWREWAGRQRATNQTL